eukprot:jgi/Tetstr1/428828/TSEL_018815.t1
MAAVVGGVGTATTPQDSIEAARHPAAAYGAFRCARCAVKTPTCFISDDEVHAPLERAHARQRTSPYGTDAWGAKVPDVLTISITANTYSNYEGKIRLFPEFCIDEEGSSPLDCTKSTCVHDLAWIAEHGTIGAGSLQPYLSAINTFLRHTARRDDAPATGPTIGAS